MGHRVRVVNQKMAINGVIADIRNLYEESKESQRALIILDYRMKFDALYFCSKRADHCEKRERSHAMGP